MKKARERLDTSVTEYIKNVRRIGDGLCNRNDIKFWKPYMDDNPKRRKQFKKSPKTKYLVCTNAKAGNINPETERNRASRYYKLQFVPHKFATN